MGLCSYPRTNGNEDEIPPAAYANCPPGIKAALREYSKNRYSVFRRHISFASAEIVKYLIASYPPPETWVQSGRRDLVSALFPEPGATKGEVPPYVTHVDNSVKDLPEYVKNTFCGTVRKAGDVLDENTVIWRFIGACFETKDGSPINTCNRLDGEFWGIGPVPSTEEEWRKFYAISGFWNGDGTYVAVKIGDLDKDVQKYILEHGAYGRTAPQPSMVPGFYFSGGEKQLWVSARGMKEKTGKTLDVPSQLGKTVDECLKPSDWNRH